MINSSRHSLLAAMLILLTVCISGCSTKQQNKQTQQTFMLMPLLDVPEALQNRTWLEKFTFSLTGNKAKIANKLAEQSMLLQSEFSQAEINVAAISFAGMPLAQAKWQVGSSQVDTLVAAAKNFNGEQVLHDLQITNWPIETIRLALYDGYRVEEQINTAVKIRRFYHQAEVIITIRYQDNNVIFEQKKIAYRLEITRLEDSPLVLN